MTALSSPLFALRPQRDGLRQKQFSLSRPRGAGQLPAAHDASGTTAPDCVFKRFPGIGDTPASTKQHW
ncbi:MAG: hypothetical protein EOP80_20305 [Variovorax sp.]|nr:MAG: hypothetical protein EOP80_20305 [Variovorax sp.]